MNTFWLIVILVVSVIVIVWWCKHRDIISKFDQRYQKMVKKAYEKTADNKVVWEMCLLISLPSRRERMKKVLKTYRIEPTIIEAEIRDNPKEGCHFSHLKALQYFLDSTASTALILEDDLEECDDYDLFSRRLRDIAWNIGGKDYDYENDKYDEVFRSWDVIYFGKCWDTCSNLLETSDPQLYKSVDMLCRHAYFVNRKGAQKLVDHLSGEFKGAGDKQMRELSRKGIITSYVVHPSLFYQARQKVKSKLDREYKPLKECIEF